jgi:YesN/AraC family two-component response regulator
MKLYIKNMVCNRCKTTVKSELDKMGIPYESVRIGEVNTVKRITPEQRLLLAAALLENGFELIDDHKNELIERLKKSIKELEQYSDEDLKTSFADYIAISADDNFISLNKLFSEIEGVTIEKYIINRKIERIKELLVYEDLNLDEVAQKMHYSNTTELSNQFKRMTGLTPSHFKQLKQTRNSIIVPN